MPYKDKKVRKACQRKCHKKLLARIKAAALAAALPGERVVITYAKDCVPCACRSTHGEGGLRCIPVAISPDKKTTRCLRCSIRWVSRSHRWQPLKIVRTNARA